ncbi:unnamed protein product [Penicillium manginii]
MAVDAQERPHGYYLYKPSHILPAVFAALVAISLILHTFQNIFWRVTFFISWGGIIFTTGWILRCISSYYPDHLGLYVAQAVFIYLAPPVYSAAAYNIVGRLMNYLPMHAVLNPDRVLIFFVYLGAAVEGMTAAGAAKNAAAGKELDEYKKGGQLIAAGLILQGVVEMLVIAIVATVHRRASKAGKVARNVRLVCFTLYGTSIFVVLRCIFRAVESFEMFDKLGCTENCGAILSNEWYLYAFELGPMLIFTYWLNLLHPGRYLPKQKHRYLDTDGQTERVGPGWRDRRSRWETFVDPLDVKGMFKGQASHEKFWENPGQWDACTDGSFAEGTASNAKTQSYAKENTLFANQV